MGHCSAFCGMEHSEHSHAHASDTTPGSERKDILRHGGFERLRKPRAILIFWAKRNCLPSAPQSTHVTPFEDPSLSRDGTYVCMQDRKPQLMCGSMYTSLYAFLCNHVYVCHIRKTSENIRVPNSGRNSTPTPSKFAKLVHQPTAGPQQWQNLENRRALLLQRKISDLAISLPVTSVRDSVASGVVHVGVDLEAYEDV